MYSVLMLLSIIPIKARPIRSNSIYSFVSTQNPYTLLQRLLYIPFVQVKVKTAHFVSFVSLMRKRHRLYYLDDYFWSYQLKNKELS